MYFLLTYRLAMLLPPSEWRLKIRAQRILVYVQSPPMQMSHKSSRVTGPTFTKFVAVVVFFIDGINATIGVVICPPVDERQGQH